MDRFDDKAREICEAARTSNLPWTEAFAMHLLRHVEERIAAAEMRAGSDAPAGKPVAGEWEVERYGRWRNMTMDGISDGVAGVYDDGRWCVYSRPSGKRRADGKAADLASAMLAADAWAREHAAELNWRLPDAPASEPAAPRAWSDEEVEACARKGVWAVHGSWDIVNKPSVMQVTREVLKGDRTGIDDMFVAAVLSHAATLRPPAAVPARPQGETDEQINAMVARAYEEGIAKGRKDAAQAETRGDLLERMAGALKMVRAAFGEPHEYIQGTETREAMHRVVDLLAECAAPPVQRAVTVGPESRGVMGRDEVPVEVHERGWQWRPVGDESAFAPPFGTIRACIDCGCLVAGGPARCVRCANGTATTPQSAPK